MVIKNKNSFCFNPSKKHYQELAQSADFFKHQPYTVNNMFELMQQLQEEGHLEDRISIAFDMLQDNKSLAEIIKYSHPTPVHIAELAQHIR